VKTGPINPNEGMSKALIARGKEQGFLTFTEIGEHLAGAHPKQIKDIVKMIFRMGIPMYEKAPNALTEADWDALEDVLRGCAPVTDQECDYLKNAFVATERMWAQNFAGVTTVRIVLLSEAPQFGTGERYFYNSDTKYSSFFYYQDAEAALGRKFGKNRTGKRFVLADLARAGFIILDVFPFALNKDDTPSIRFDRQSLRYRELFQRTAPLYFNKKCDLILESSKPLFLIRYGGMQNSLGDLVDAELAKRGVDPTYSVGGTNMTLDRDKLKQMCRDAFGGPDTGTSV
jgi:hypothetical protein